MEVIRQDSPAYFFRVGLILFRHHIAVHPATQRLRKRHGRQLRGIRPGRADELHYRAELRKIVNRLRAATDEIARSLRPSWPFVHDETAPGAPGALEKAAAEFGDVPAIARRLTNVRDRLSVVRRTLATVDERLIAEIKRSVGVDISHALNEHDVAAEMQKAARANVELITSIPSEHLGRVRSVIDEAFRGGARWESLVAKLREVGDITDRRAAIIARDQAAKMNSAFNRVRQTNLGIQEYTWSGALDARERSSHRAMEGVRCRWDAPPSVDGERVNPGEAILCRCIARPLVDLAVIEANAAQAEAVAA